MKRTFGLTFVWGILFLAISCKQNTGPTNCEMTIFNSKPDAVGRMICQVSNDDLTVKNITDTITVNIKTSSKTYTETIDGVTTEYSGSLYRFDKVWSFHRSVWNSSKSKFDENLQTRIKLD